MKLVLVPGLATDTRLFAAQRADFPDLILPPWIEPLPREALASYAARLAATVDTSEPLVVGGVSLGGMLALEMARHLPARHVVLIGSCRAPRAVNRWLHAAERVARPLPTRVAERVKTFAPLVCGRGGGIPPAGRRLLADMVRDSHSDFIRWGARALLEWPGCPDPGVPVSHIHGERDWVIPLKFVTACRVIRGGSHVLNLSHPAEVTAFLREALETARSA